VGALGSGEVEAAAGGEVRLAGSCEMSLMHVAALAQICAQDPGELQVRGYRVATRQVNVQLRCITHRQFEQPRW